MRALGSSTTRVPWISASRRYQLGSFVTSVRDGATHARLGAAPASGAKQTPAPARSIPCRSRRIRPRSERSPSASRRHDQNIVVAPIWIWQNNVGLSLNRRKHQDAQDVTKSREGPATADP